MLRSLQCLGLICTIVATSETYMATLFSPIMQNKMFYFSTHSVLPPCIRDDVITGNKITSQWRHWSMHKLTEKIRPFFLTKSLTKIVEINMDVLKINEQWKVASLFYFMARWGLGEGVRGAEWRRRVLINTSAPNLKFWIGHLKERQWSP